MLLIIFITIVKYKKGRLIIALTLEWIKCKGGNWCSLITVNLDHSHFDGLEGVYIIWHGGQNPTTVRVGQGIIRDRLDQHKQDSEILAYRQYKLYVAWARVVESQRDGVERFLGETLNPLVGTRLPNAMPIEVNLPW